MRSRHSRWVLAICMAPALLASACASILNPHPAPDPENLSLSERRALVRSLVADPDPPLASAWSGVDAGAAR